MKTHSFRIVICCILFGTLLSGCSHHKNPLLMHDPKRTAQFLVEASRFAEKDLNLYQEPGGQYYGLCMTGGAKLILCTHVYKAMRRYAKKVPDFKAVSVRDLTDRASWKKLKSWYRIEQFNGV